MKKISPELFVSMSFNEGTMEQYVPASGDGSLARLPESGKPLPLTANDIAEAMKTRALEHGATHFTHWFQPRPASPPKSTIALSIPSAAARSSWTLGQVSWCVASPTPRSFPSGGLRATLRRAGLPAHGTPPPLFHQGRQPCNPDGVLLLRRRGAGQEDPAAALERGG